MPESRGPEFPDGPEIPEFTDAELTSVFDDAFVAAAPVREPTADERLLGRRARPADPAEALSGFPEPDEDPWSSSGRTAVWRRGVAWVLAVVMGMGVVAMAVTAVHRAGASPGRTQPQPAVGSGTPVPGAPGPPGAPGVPRDETPTYGPAARAG